MPTPEAAPSTTNLVPRLYQLEVVELAKQSNVVAYLDTGAGKTFIAVLLLRHRLETAAAARAAAAATGAPAPPPWKAVFLAPQVALVEQQAAVLARSIDARVKKVVGADIVSWTGQAYVTNWRSTLDSLDVLVATPQILVDLLSRGVISGLGTTFDVVIYDEAHHCKGGHPYARIMEFYRREKAAGGRVPLPRIFGTSAAPAGAGAAKLATGAMAKGLRDLEAALDARVVTCAGRAGVEAAVPQPDLMIERFDPGAAAPTVYPALASLYTSIERAASRLDIAVSLAELRWKAGMEGAFNGSSGSGGAAQYTSFEPGAPRFKITRLKDVLRSILHVLDQVGAYGAAQSTLDALRWLGAGAPNARVDGYTGFYGANGGLRTSYSESSTDSFESLGGFGVGTAAPRRLALETLQARAAIEGFSIQEIGDLSVEASKSTVAVVEAFAAAFHRTAPVAALAALRAAADAGQPLRRAPIDIMATIVAAVRPQDLAASLSSPGATAAAAAHQRFRFPLLSSKTAALVAVLQRYKARSTSQFQWSGIVFAQQRLAVLALAAVLSALPSTSSWLRISPLMAQGAAFGTMDFSPEDQRAILDQFRSGALNLLVATSVAEEGIDVRSCQLVIRFDPAPTAQAFHQSRGRARAAGSHLVVLVAAGNAEEEAAVARMAAYQAQMREAALQNVAGLAERGADEEGEEGKGDGDWQEESMPDYVIPATGAQVRLRTAAHVLNQYVSQLPGDQFMLLRPAWRLEYFGDGFTQQAQQIRATVRLPSSSPIHLVEGPLAPTKRVAKAAAALEAVMQLHRLGALNDHLMPTALGGSEDDDEYLDEKEVEVVEEQGQKVKRPRRRMSMIELVRTPPAGLATPLPLLEDVFEGTTVFLHGFGWKKEGSGEWMELAVLLPGTMEAAPGGGGEWGDATPVGEFALTKEQLGLVMRCSEALGGVAWLGSNGAAPTYVLAPLRQNSGVSPQELDWKAIQKIVWLLDAADKGTTVLELLRGGAAEALHGTALTTEYNHMTYTFAEISPDMTLASPFPSSTGSANRRSGGGSGDSFFSTFADYYSKRWEFSDLDPSQPLIRAERAALGRLRRTTAPTAAVTSDQADADESVFLVPQLCTVHPVPLALCPAAAAVPRLLWHLEGDLLASELLCALQASGLSPDVCPPPLLLRQALTAPSALDASLGDYETLEALGDAALKWAASAQLFLGHPAWHEGQLTATKDRMVSNKRLIEAALALELQRRVRVESVAGGNGRGTKRRNGGAEVELNETLAADSPDKGVKRNSKLLADAVEAIVGAFFVNGGLPAALSLLRHLGLADVPLEALSPAANIGAPVNGSVSDSRAADAAAAAATALGHRHRFQRPWLALEALTHGSVLGQRCYQRLEFMGDAVLDLVLLQQAHVVAAQSDVLFTPARLHDLRSVTLNAERLALVAVRSGLHKHILHNSNALFNQIDAFVAAAEAAVAAAAAERRLSPADAWNHVFTHFPFGLDDVCAPKVLSDIVEALAGAVWLDAGGDVDVAWAALEPLLAPLPWMNPAAHIPAHPVRRIYELAAKTGLKASFDIVESTDAYSAQVAVRVSFGDKCLGPAAPPPAQNRGAASRLSAQALLRDLGEEGICRKVL